MSQERLPMRKIREVLRLKAEGLSKRRIAASLGISATAAVECLQRVRRAGLSWPLPDGLDDAALELRLYPPATSQKVQWPEAAGRDAAAAVGEFRGRHPDGLGYSRFCEIYISGVEGPPDSDDEVHPHRRRAHGWARSLGDRSPFCAQVSVVVDIALANGTTKRCVTQPTQRVAAILRALDISGIKPPTPPQHDTTVL
jgi:hypothetical protein